VIGVVKRPGDMTMISCTKRGCDIFPVSAAAFLLLSGIDFFLTWKLITSDASEVDEINPVAFWVLQSFGWSGLAVYKSLLVTAILALVLAIAWRRRSAAQSVSVFGCGAQAAVVVTSLLILCGKHNHGNGSTEESRALHQLEIVSPTLPPGGFALLGLECVQKELDLSAETIYDIQMLTEARNTLRRNLRMENLSEEFSLIRHLFGKEREIAVSLTAKQTQRLQQLCWQARGPLALGEADVSMVLRLSDEQIEAIEQIRAESAFEPVSISSRRPVANARQAKEDSAHVNRRLLAVLDADQRIQWQDMMGAPFQFSASIVAFNQPPKSPVTE
jgi:hypothetical protein